MNIFDYAMQMEKNGEVYYRELAKKTNFERLKSILNMLASDEVKHFEVLKKMKEDNRPDMAETQILSNVKNIFQEIKEKGEKIELDNSNIELYNKALDIEKKSEDFYLHKSAESENLDQREILKKIAEEEKKHYHLIENIIEFISRPNNWVENAEFYHLDEY